MKVRATKTGYIHNHFKNVDDEFEVTEKQFSEKWMEKIEDEEKPKSASKSKKSDAREPIALSKLKPESVLPSEGVI